MSFTGLDVIRFNGFSHDTREKHWRRLNRPPKIKIVRCGMRPQYVVIGNTVYANDQMIAEMQRKCEVTP